MNILFTCFEYDSLSGVTSFTRDLATGLTRRGHRVAIHGGRLGKIAEATDRSIFLTARMDRLPFRPDIIHAQQQPTIVRALLTFPDTPLIAICHDATALKDEPFFAPGIRRYVAVDKRCEARIARNPNIPVSKTCVILNAVDLDRFSPGPPLPPRPKRALIYSNYAKRHSHMEPIMRACERAGIDVSVIGAGMGRAAAHPEQELPLYDIVFAKARCALEAMAMGRAVILCDTTGLGRMVSRADVERFRPMNFGAGLLDRPLDADLIAREIDRYDPADAAQVADAIRATAGLSDALDTWMALYREVLAEPSPATGDEGHQDLKRRDRRWSRFLAAYSLTRGLRHVDRLPLVGKPLQSAMISAWDRIWG